MIGHRLRFEDIDRDTELWTDVFDVIDGNFEKVVYRLEYEGRRFIVEEIDVPTVSTREFRLSRYYIPGRNNLSVWIDGVRQYPYRDFRETDSASFVLLGDRPLDYRSKVMALYSVQEHPLDGYSVSEDTVGEYEEASGGYHDPKDRVRAELESMIDGMMEGTEVARSRARLFLSDIDEVSTQLDYLEGYEDSSLYEPGVYYVTPNLDADGTIRWVKSEANMDKPRARTFANRVTRPEGAVFIGTGEDSLAEPLVGEGVVLNDEIHGPHYGPLPVRDGGLGGDAHSGGRVTGILVLDNHEGLTRDEMAYGVYDNTREPDTIYNPGFSVGVLSVANGGTGVGDSIDIYEDIDLDSDTPLDFGLLSSLDRRKVMARMDHYRQYVGKTFKVPTYDAALGDLEFVCIGMGRPTDAVGPKFYLIAKSPVLTAPLSIVPQGSYQRYDRLETLHNCLNAIYGAIDYDIRGNLYLPPDVQLNDLDDGRIDMGVLNPTSPNGRYTYSMTGGRLWILSLSELDIDSNDRVIPANYFDYFSMMAWERILGIIGDSEGVWTRSQAPSNDGPMYYCIMGDGSVEPVPVDRPMGIVPLICV